MLSPKPSLAVKPKNHEPDVVSSSSPPALDDRDRLLHAFEARLTGSLSPASLILAFQDWALHLANAPRRRAALGMAALTGLQRLFQPAYWISPAPNDRRFRDAGWAQFPFNMLEQSFLLTEDWWRQATAKLPGVTKGHADIVSFTTRQLLDIASPSNLAWTNPEVLRKAAETRGANFGQGLRNLADDLMQVCAGKPRTGDVAFEVGKDVAVTPGKVVFRNALMELIQYAPTTPEVRAEPILIVPAWIMKYYILDLSPHNSFIRYLVGQGFTVFCISWVNPGPELRDTGFDDYRRLGVMEALAAIDRICGGPRVHACGYCLGGTLLAIAAAAMARDKDNRLKTISLLAAQTDFTEAGELQLFTDESQLALLDDMMWRQGYLDSSQMAGAFQMLRSNDLFWSRIIREYLLGERENPTDLMSWNADATRMPYRMHSQYLHQMFLNDDLAEGRFFVDDAPVAISDVAVPLFVVGTETDHVAPWRSVYKIHLFNQGEITFVLTSGGHNAGVVSEPGHPHRHYRIARREPGRGYVAPDAWCGSAENREGSWWSAFAEWLKSNSGKTVSPPAMGEGHGTLGDAPGTYVRQA
jgi:polyhydroxyalkanoate synthase